MPSKRVFKLRLFPNTGHQFFTLDLEELLSQGGDRQGGRSAPPSFQDLNQFVKDQQPGEAASEKREKLAGWKQWSPDTAWILYRYDQIFDPQHDTTRPALQLAIESNLGGWDRGTIYGIDHRPEGSPPVEHPLYQTLKAKGIPTPNTAAAAFPPYVAQESTLFIDFPEKGMWLEDAFGGGVVRLPSRLDPRDPKAAKYAEYRLPKECVRIEWIESQRETPIEVDLIVDLGNTRTVALLLEDHGKDAKPFSFGERVEVVRFLPPGWPYKSAELSRNLEPYGLIDSWILLHRSTFANLEPPFSTDKLRTFETESATHPATKAYVHLIDQRFVANAPVVIGGGREATGAAKTLAWAAQAENAKDAPFFLSSPKRYAWDDVSMGRREQYWRLVPNRHDADCRRPGDNGPSLAEFESIARLFMNPGDPNFDLPGATIFSDAFAASTDPTRKAGYPRRDAICWFALGIIEAAYRQLHSVDFSENSHLKLTEVLRKLRKIRVTYPSGWTGEEREAYLFQWQRAIRLFAIAHLSDPRPQTEGGQAPVLTDDPVDEAIASQLPLLLAEIKNLGNSAHEWLKLYGNGHEVKVMNIDVGGGTTDVAIISYTQPDGADFASQNGHALNSKAELQAKLEFRDGNNIAGDVLVKSLIERILLPAWLKVRGEQLLFANPEARKLIQTIFSAPEQSEVSEREPAAEQKLRRIVRLALVPLANELLGRLVEAERTGAERISPIRVSNVVDRSAIDDLNRLVLKVVLKGSRNWDGLDPKRRTELGRNESLFTQWFGELQNIPSKLPFTPNAELEFTVAELNGIIDETFGPMLRQMAQVAGQHEADLVILSGKPSELPRMRALVLRDLPLPSARILHVRGYHVGDWYPPSLVEEGGRIRDAKTVTVTGAALYEDIKNGYTTGLKITSVRADAAAASQDFYWGVFDGQSFLGDFIAVPGERSRPHEFNLSIGSYVGRSLNEKGRPEPVYQLSYCVNEGQTEPKDARNALVTASLQLVPHAKFGHRVEIVPGSVRFPDAAGAELDPACVQLKLRTIIGEDFWMDRPRFTVDFSAIGNPS